jgi:hypothetical protein
MYRMKADMLKQYIGMTSYWSKLSQNDFLIDSVHASGLYVMHLEYYTSSD